MGGRFLSLLTVPCVSQITCLALWPGFSSGDQEGLGVWEWGEALGASRDVPAPALLADKLCQRAAQSLSHGTGLLQSVPWDCSARAT